MSSEVSGKQIARNTLFLYFRQLILLAVSLYTIRIILDVLGASDYGLYNVVGGIVLMFSFINAGMIQASQRFLSYEMGCNSGSTLLTKVFASINTIHWMIAGVTILLAETIGLWFINTQLNIPEGREIAANWVYQFSIISFVFGVLGVPFNASLIAHERMDVFAYISVGEAILKLIIVYIVQISFYDKLITYGFLVLFVALLNTSVLWLYCRNYYVECRKYFTFEKGILKRIIGFASWSFVGNIGFSFKNQGVNFIINIFFGTTVNAARGVAYSVSSVVSQFANNFMMAITPQITKQYAAGDINNMIKLSFTGSKFSFFLLYIMGLPAIILAPVILKYWLVDIPEYTIIFLQLAIVLLMVDGLATPIGKAIDATGNNKLFQITVAIIMLMDLPISYFLLRNGYEPYTVMYVALFTSVIALFARLAILKKYVPLVSYLSYLKEVIIPSLKVIVMTIMCVIPIIYYMPNTDIIMLLSAILSFVVALIAIYIFGLNLNEQNFVKNFIKKKIKR